MPAIAVDQPTCSVTGIPSSRASPLPHWDASSIAAAQGPPIPSAQPNAKLHTVQKCGSGLAREGGGSANMFGDWHTAFAGKPAPTLGGCVVRSCGATRQFQPRSQTRSFTPIKNVGAGLLAKAVDQPTCSVTGIPLSRASPLPHWDVSSIAAAQGPAIPTAQPNAKLHTDQKCGSGLARESSGSANMFGDWHTAFAGKPAPTLGDASSIAAAQGPAISTAQPNAKLHTAPTLGCVFHCCGARPGNSNRAAKREASHRSKCGSGLAREGGGSEPAQLADPPQSPPRWRRSNVGASSHIK